MEPRRIAVIEDEPSIAASVAARLRSEGFEVELAGDGHAGVELCRSYLTTTNSVSALGGPSVSSPLSAGVCTFVACRR